MSLIVDFALLCFGFFLLTKGADYFIENSATIARRRGAETSTKQNGKD